MTQEEKQLLIKDLSARLSYNVKVDITYSKEHGSSDRLRICSEGCLMLNTDVLGLYIEDEICLKPYLRPMESMTEEESKEFALLQTDFYGILYPIAAINMISWLNAHHFDYRGLIEKGLAIAVTNENNPYK